MLALHENPVSTNSLKVRFLLEELGLEYERREVPLARPRPAEYVELNPLSGVPTLVDGDLVLAESNAILRYLANRYGGEELYPADPVARAPVDELLDRFSLTLRPAFFSVESLALGFSPQAGFGGGPADPAAALRKAGEIAGTLRIFDALVDPGGYALGYFSIADCAAAPVLYRTLRTGMDLSPYPNLARWRDTVTARPAFERAGPVG